MKRELFAASFLAVALSAGLGTMSFGLFAGAPAAGKLETVLDVYTQKGGLGLNVSGGIFEPGDIVPVFAYLTVGGVQVNGSQVTFAVIKPNGSQTASTSLTNDLGVGEISLSLLPSEGHLIGTWQVFANASANDEAANDTMTLQCRLENARIDVLSEKNGAASISFLPSDEVFLEARLSYGNASIAGAPVTFEVKTPNDTDFLSSALTTASTDSFGKANVTFQIPWPSDTSLGTWHATVTGLIYEQVMNATATFDCELVAPVIDVYTQKGGQGPNAVDGTFLLNETVFVYAEVRNSLNQTVPNVHVSFEFKFFNTTSVPWTWFAIAQVTDSSGMANATTRLPPVPEYAGAWAIYATTQYNDMILIDTLTFTAQQQ